MASLQAKDAELKQMEARIAELQYRQSSLNQHAERLEYEKLRTP